MALENIDADTPMFSTRAFCPSDEEAELDAEGPLNPR